MNDHQSTAGDPGNMPCPCRPGVRAPSGV